MKALIFGCNGQDGSYMSELLVTKGYEVHGTIRRSSVLTTQRIDHLFKTGKIRLHYSDVTDHHSVFSLITKLLPDEIYNFAAQSHVKISAELENYTFQTNTIGVLNVLQTVRHVFTETGKNIKVYQASTSEEFGNTTDGSFMLNEAETRFPVSVYGISKLAADHLCHLYKNAYGLYVVSGTLFNHESPRRGHNFVTQKIARYVARQDFSKPLPLGNLNARRDWGHAKDYMTAIWLMMQQDKPLDYVVATGETHSVKEFVECAFAVIGLQIRWEGTGAQEKGFFNDNLVIVVDPKYYREIDIECLIGDATKITQDLGWRPAVSFNGLVEEMVKNHIACRRSAHVHRTDSHLSNNLDCGNHDIDLFV